MGKGDQKTRRGKVTAGSYGKTRPKKSAKAKLVAATVVEKPKKQTAPKAEKPKKVAKPEEKVAEEKPKTTRKKKTEE